jgi:hypothetical protein
MHLTICQQGESPTITAALLAPLANQLSTAAIDAVQAGDAATLLQDRATENALQQIALLQAQWESVQAGKQASDSRVFVEAEMRSMQVRD